MPPYIGLEWPGISTGTYFSNDADTTSAMKDKIEFTIEAVGLCYESLVMSESERISRDLQQGTLSTFFDVPKISYQAVLANQQHLNMSVLVPAGTKTAFVGFVYGHQLWPNKTSLKNITARTKFPDSLRKITFSIAGHETVGFRRGFEGLGLNHGYSSESCRNYFNDLRAEGIIDDIELEEMFPRDAGKKSFIQILLLDLRPYRIKKNTTLYVECEFSANLSPERTNLLTIMMRELQLYKARGFWHTKFTDGE